MTKTDLWDDATLAAISLEWWPPSFWNRWPPSSESAARALMGILPSLDRSIAPTPEPLARSVDLTQRRLQPSGPCAIHLAEPGVAEPVGCRGGVFVPQQRQRHVRRPP